MKTKRILALIMTAILLLMTTVSAFAADADCAHTSLVWRVDVEATADHAGTMSQYCTDCGKVMQTSSFSQHTHTPGHQITLVSPYCETEGELGVCCKVCGAVYETSVIPALGHSGGRGVGISGSALEVVFLIDESGSMWSNDPGHVRIDVSKDLVNEFSAADKGAVVGFGSYDRVLCTFTSDKDTLKNAIDKISDDGGSTYMYSGMQTAFAQFPETASGSRYIVLLTDGQAHDKGHFDYAAASADKNVKIYTVGLGRGVNESDLQEIADRTGGKYYFATVPEDLVDIFKELGKEIIYSAGTWVTTITPTCHTPGERVCYCSRCGQAIGSEAIEPTSHVYSACVDINTESHTGTCINCGKTVTEFHDWTIWSYNGDNTFFKNGTISRSCIGCGKVETVKAKHTSIIARFFYPGYELVLRWFNRMPFNWINALVEWVHSW
jgi:hypothetical protein